MSGTAVTLLMTADHEAITSGIGTATILGVDEPISAGAARRLAAEAGIIPVIMDGKSVPLDMGSTKRLFTEAQRYAMALRDGGCVWGCCPVPPNQCQSAHIRAWRDSKSTNIGNGILLCEYHHQRFDLDGWDLEFNDGPYLIPPAHIDPTRTPRRCQQRAIAPPDPPTARARESGQQRATAPPDLPP
ncbi:hypothetical protein GCM10025866_04110 [Naasia aerilata]|uniref:DUF222 domain-containing protein n=1 Tax=Naasia aerilata TaxID=1162966 RepID=A0ABM8G8K1_9MICO|nr:hypothetical protein GCM10025866_04110 [Naasia aerilata]